MSTVVSNNELAAGIRSKIIGISAIMDELASENEVREHQYAGKSYGYPAIRIDVQRQSPGVVNTEKCVVNQAFWVIRVYDENDSSLDCDRIAGIVANQLDRSNIDATNFQITVIYLNSLIGAVRVTEKLWMAQLVFTGNVYAKE